MSNVLQKDMAIAMVTEKPGIVWPVDWDRQLLSSVACNIDSYVLAGVFPLFQEQKVEAIEWSFDTLFGTTEMPPWFEQLLTVYSQSGRLVGHGVFFSMFSGRWSEEQSQWLEDLKKLADRFQFDHVTEHFGFMTGANFHQGAPLNIPFTDKTLAIGVDRLARIRDAAQCPVGLENLAFAYHPDEVKRHGDFLEKLITPVDGFIILDLHNLYCQLHNFDMRFESLINAYPLDRVREIHISGGSWEKSELDDARMIRRDTHDDRVPKEVFELLKKSIPLCPNLKFIVMEQIGTALENPLAQMTFREDFDRMKNIVDINNALIQNSPDSIKSNAIKKFNSVEFSLADHPLEDESLAKQQEELSDILENIADFSAAKLKLENSSLSNSDWEIEKWTPYMLETALNIAQKWKG